MANRQGFTLIETVVSLVLLAIVVLGIQGMAANVVTATTRSNSEVLGMQLVEDRIDLIRMDPQYTSIKARYTATEDSIPGWPGYTRVTTITQRRDSTSRGITDWLKVTVSVTGPNLASPVYRTITIGSP